MKYIQEKKADKKQGQVINKLVRNDKMTPDEARKAVANVNESLGKRTIKKRDILDL